MNHSSLGADLHPAVNENEHLRPLPADEIEKLLRELSDGDGSDGAPSAALEPPKPARAAARPDYGAIAEQVRTILARQRAEALARHDPELEQICAEPTRPLDDATASMLAEIDAKLPNTPPL